MLALHGHGQLRPLLRVRRLLFRSGVLRRTSAPHHREHLGRLDSRAVQHAEHLQEGFGQRSEESGARLRRFAPNGAKSSLRFSRQNAFELTAKRIKTTVEKLSDERPQLSNRSVRQGAGRLPRWTGSPERLSVGCLSSGASPLKRLPQLLTSDLHRRLLHAPVWRCLDDAARRLPWPPRRNLALLRRQGQSHCAAVRRAYRTGAYHAPQPRSVGDPELVPLGVPTLFVCCAGSAEQLFNP
eukprot:scaffold1659_cov255-Pinguiococcus_pyrenoidosus.AAC.18